MKLLSGGCHRRPWEKSTLVQIMVWYHQASSHRRQVIIWTNAVMLLIGPSRTNLNVIVIEIYTFLFTEMHLKLSFAKLQPSCLCLNVFKNWQSFQFIIIKINSSLTVRFDQSAMSRGIHLRVILHEKLTVSILDMSVKMTNFMITAASARG